MRDCRIFSRRPGWLVWQLPIIGSVFGSRRLSRSVGSSTEAQRQGAPLADGIWTWVSSHFKISVKASLSPVSSDECGSANCQRRVTLPHRRRSVRADRIKSRLRFRVLLCKQKSQALHLLKTAFFIRIPFGKFCNKSRRGPSLRCQVVFRAN